MGHLRVGYAHYLLEDYYAAKDACLDGLSIDPDEQLLHVKMKLNRPPDCATAGNK